MNPVEALTGGVHHVGLTVAGLEASAEFFTRGLGWTEVRRDPDYPAIFVSDGTVMVSLWQTRDGSQQRGFDKDSNVGLHHVAFLVDSETRLDTVYRRLCDMPGVKIEFSPELLRQGPAKHTMCYEPGGIRIEFIWPGG